VFTQIIQKRSKRRNKEIRKELKKQKEGAITTVAKLGTQGLVTAVVVAAARGTPSQPIFHLIRLLFKMCSWESFWERV